MKNSIKIYLPNGGIDLFAEGIEGVQSISTNGAFVCIVKSNGDTIEYNNLPFSISRITNGEE